MVFTTSSATGPQNMHLLDTRKILLNDKIALKSLTCYEAKCYFTEGLDCKQPVQDTFYIMTTVPFHIWYGCGI